LVAGTPSSSSEKSAILFVEEEDIDDIERYNHEDDFICPDLRSCCSRVCLHCI